MIFKDRNDAGRKLGAALEQEKQKDLLVLGIPRGGVEVACQAARHLNAALSLLIVRKLPFPENPESGFGAVAEDGSTFLIPNAERTVSQVVIEQVVQEQQAEVERRVATLRRGKALPSLRGRRVVLVDDGIAMGSTIQAAVSCCRNRSAEHITVAAPVASPRALASLETAADRVVVLHAPGHFRTVASFYKCWYDVTDHEVLEILNRADADGLLVSE